MVWRSRRTFAGWLSWQGWREWHRRRWLSKLHAVERLYQQMLRTLAAEGFRKHPAQTPLEYADRARNRYASEVAESIDAIVRAYVSWRYGGATVDVRSLEQRWQTCRSKQRRFFR